MLALARIGKWSQQIRINFKVTLILNVRWHGFLNLCDQMAKSNSPVEPKAGAAKSEEELLILGLCA